MVTIPIVGTDAPGGPDKKERSIAPPFWVYSIVRAGAAVSPLCA